MSDAAGVLRAEWTRVRHCAAAFASILVLVAPGAATADAGSPWPDPTRFESKVLEFERADAVAMPSPGGLLAIGSSSIAAWHGTIAQDLAPLPVIPRGFGGSVMNDVLHYADRLVLPYRPRAILLYEGDNDVARGIPTDSIRASFDRLVTRVHRQLPRTRFYVMSIKPSGARWEKWPQMQQVNASLEQACRQDPRLIFVDVGSHFIGVDTQPDTLFFINDQLHLNAAGYDVWTAILRPVLLEGESHAAREGE